MQQTINRSWWITILTFIAYGFFFLAWVLVVEPYPDRDSVSQFYFPFKNYLQASIEIGNDFIFLKGLIPNEYPNGGLLLAALISSLGLQDFVLNQPWLVNLILVFVLSLIATQSGFKGVKKIIFILLVFTFPINQIALKNFNLHSFNFIFFLGGMTFFFRFLKTRKRSLCVSAICLLWFACSVKHLGVVFFGMGWFSLLLWKTNKNEPIKELFNVAGIVALLTLPFYLHSGIKKYVVGIMAHNPELDSSLALSITSITAIVGILVLIACAKSNRSKAQIPKLFDNGLIFFLLAISLCWIISLDSDFSPIPCMLFSMIIGSLTIIIFMLQFDFKDLRGLKILFILISLTLALTLYFSRLAQVSMIFFPTIYVLMLVTFEENKTLKLPILILITFVTVSNFFPNLEDLENRIGSKGFGLYARGLNTLHQNLLNWNKSKISLYRNSIENSLSNVDFEKGQKALLTLHPHLHSYTALELQFPDHFLFSFPPMTLLEQLPSEKLEKIYEHLKINKLEGLNYLLEEGEFPLLIVGNDVWSEYLKIKIDLNNIPNIFERNEFCNWLNLALWKYLIEHQSLDELYDVQFLPSESQPELLLYIHRRFDKVRNTNQISYKPGLVAIKDKYRLVTNPEILIAKLLFEKASIHFDKNQFWEASILLRLANQLDPLHKDIQQDLKIVLNSLPNSFKAKHKLYQIGGEADNLQLGLNQLWGYQGSLEGLSPEVRAYLINDNAMTIPKPLLKTRETAVGSNKADYYFKKASEVFNSNQKLAKDYLIQTLQLEPSHTEALRDLNILEQNLSAQNFISKQEDLATKTKAEKLFQESSMIVKQNKIRALILLRKVLKLNPNHKKAKRSLELLKLQLGINSESK
ncbi:MAG: hypothetical protein VX619_09405 [bacterium]|nr:hypothetical protein [bacterium]